MKKILLSTLALFSFAVANAQAFTANDSISFSSWTNFDLDNDSLTWGITDLTGAGSALDAQGGCVLSSSWVQAGALTPDNLIVSPPIDCSTGSAVTLNWGVGSRETTASGFHEEHYAVYVITSITGIITGTFPTPVFEATLSAGEVMLNESVDISSIAAGQTTVYLAFRHYDCSDENFIILDDVSITGAFTSTNENELSVLNAYPNPATDVLNLTLNEVPSYISILSVDGKVISRNSSVNSLNTEVNISDLETGMYLYEITSKKGVKTVNSFIKE